jgi:hypothetical protein
MSSNPPATKTGITWMEIVSDSPELIALANGVKNKFSTVPTTAVGWADAVGASKDGLAYASCAAFDRFKGGHVTVEMFAGIVGLDPAGLLAQAIALGQKIAAQIKD